MSAELILGAISLGIQTVDVSEKVLKFIYNVVINTRHFGDQVTSIKSRVISEVSRLHTFSNYLKDKDAAGTPKMSTLHSSTQSAIVSLIQELEVAFAAYTTYVTDRDITELQKSYAKSLEKGLEEKKIIVDQRVQEGKVIHEKSSLVDKLQWGLFEKRKVLKLLGFIEQWNDRLMNLLLCGVLFQISQKDSTSEDSIMSNVTVSTGISLKSLIEEQQQSTDTAPSMIESSLKVENIDSKTRLAKLVKSVDGQDTTTRVFIEKKPFELRRRASDPPAAVIQRVERLAALLAIPKAKNAGFHSLQCIGVLRLPPPETAYMFAFELAPDQFPENVVPTTLLQALESKSLNRPTLEERFAMARSLVQTVFQFHSVNWLHKSIRSENILFGYQENHHLDYCNPFLVGFEFSREDKDKSTTEQDDRLDRNVYRHPDRQGPPEERFSAIHDIYALGVVLLEIGLWRIAVNFEKDYKDMKPEEIMNSLQQHARDRLPHYMGTDYTEAVVACLTGSLLQGRDQSAGLTDAQRLELNLSLLENVFGRIEWRS